MKINFTNSSFGLILLTIGMACSANDETVDPQVINDNSGLTIDLEWTTGGSKVNSTSDMDLDISLIKGSIEVDASRNYYSYENVDLKAIYSDGEYALKMYVSKAASAGTYTLYINGMDKTGAASKSYNGQIAKTDSGSTIEVIRITKSGNTYKLSR